MPVDKFGRMSDLKTKDTGVSLTYINNNYVRSDGETPLTGSLDMRGNTLYNVADPVNPQDVVTKVYVDNTKGSGVIGRKVGDAVSIKENLDFLGKQRIKNLPDPVNDHDAATKEYVDEKDAVTKEYVDDKTKNLFIDENDNIAFGLNVDMEGNKIFSLPKPEQDNEPATKKYVDDLQTHYIDKRGNVRFDRNINVGNNRIFALKDPKKDYEATNKKYVDDSITKRLQEEKDNFLPQDPATKEYVDEAIKQVAGGDILVSKEGVFIKANGHYRATAPLDIDNHKMENLPDPVDEKDAVNKKYIDGIVENLTLKQGLVRENGGFNLVDSYINMNFNNVRNLGLPKDESDAVPRRFVDSEIKEVEEKIQKIKEKSEERPFLKENGNYQASTSINMNFNKLLNLQKPTEPYDAVTKDYVDYVEKEIKEKLEKRKHLIAVHARYCGDLKNGKYQFKFNGGNFENCEEIVGQYEDFKGSITGFVMPHSGGIKKIICEVLTFRSSRDILEFFYFVLLTNYKKKNLQLSDFWFLEKFNYKNIEDILKKGFDDFFKKLTKYNKENENVLRRNDRVTPVILDITTDFQIVKFEKIFKSESYNSQPNKPEIITSVFMEKMETKALIFLQHMIGNGVIERRTNNGYFNLSEGDVINIKTFTKNPPFINIDDLKGEEFVLNKFDDFVKTGLNYNFTFLIELDPL